MGVNDSGSPVRRVRLTDQALVAVALARQVAEAAGRPACTGDLLVGLATEPDGLAGHLLREHGRPTAMVEALSRRCTAPAALETAVAAAAQATAPRPPGTRDLLRAALEAGGAALAEQLEESATDVEALAERLRFLDGWDADPDADAAWRLLDRWDTTWSEASETVGLPAASLPDAGLTPHAALALARTRAVAGGAVELLLAVSVVTGGDEPAGLDLADLCLAIEAQQRRSDDRKPGWDHGLEPVERAARALRAGAAVTPGDLVIAAHAVGGTGPGRILAAAEARARGGDR